MLFHCTGHIVKLLMHLTHLQLIYKKIIVDISRSNAHFILILGDFDAKSSKWSSNDTATTEDAQLGYCLCD